MFAVQCNILDGISIHASEKEATGSSSKDGGANANFNPRLREGGDYEIDGYTTYSAISIHASEKEATAIL